MERVRDLQDHSSEKRTQPCSTRSHQPTVTPPRTRRPVLRNRRQTRVERCALMAQRPPRPHPVQLSGWGSSSVTSPARSTRTYRPRSANQQPRTGRDLARPNRLTPDVVVHQWTCHPTQRADPCGDRGFLRASPRQQVGVSSLSCPKITPSPTPATTTPTRPDTQPGPRNPRSPNHPESALDIPTSFILITRGADDGTHNTSVITRHPPCGDHSGTAQAAHCIIACHGCRG